MALLDCYRGVEPTTSPSLLRDSFFPKGPTGLFQPLKLRLTAQPETSVTRAWPLAFYLPERLGTGACGLLHLT